MTMFYTYAHFRKDTGAMFYIGKGSGVRAWVKEKRNKWWRAVAEKAGYEIQILATWCSELEAFDHEKFLIKYFREVGIRLTNISDGGQGPCGLRLTEDQKKASSIGNKKRMTPEVRKKLSEKLMGHSNNKGYKKTADHIAKLVESKQKSTPRYSEGGLSMTVREWAQHLGAHQSTIRYRIQTGKSPSGKLLKSNNMKGCV